MPLRAEAHGECRLPTVALMSLVRCLGGCTLALGARPQPPPRWSHVSLRILADVVARDRGGVGGGLRAAGRCRWAGARR